MTRFLFPTLGSNNDRIFSLHFFSNQKLGEKKWKKDDKLIVSFSGSVIVLSPQTRSKLTKQQRLIGVQRKQKSVRHCLSSTRWPVFFIFQTIRHSPRFLFFKKSCPIFSLPPSPIIFNVPKIRLVYLARHERHRQLVSIRSKRVDRRYQLIKPILILKFFPTNLPSTLLQKNINADAARIESAATIFCCLCRPL